MKKIIMFIAVLLVLAMMLPVTAFAAEKTVKTEAIELEKYGQKTYTVGPAIKNAPIVDGVIEENEYSTQVRFEDPALYTTDLTFGVKTDAPTEEWKNSEYIDYYFAWDDDFIYIAFVDKQGYESDVAWNYRNNYSLRFGFNLGDFSEYVEIHLAGNGGDFTSVGEMPSIGMTSGINNTAVSTDQKAIIAAYAAKTCDKDGLKYSEPAQWTRTFEMILSKAQLLAMINFYCGTEYAELPNAMLYAHANRSYYEISEVMTADPKQTVHSLWGCAPLTDAQMTELQTDFLYVPNVIIFGESLSVPSPKEETEPEDVETEPEDVETKPEDVETKPDETAPEGNIENNAGDDTAQADEGGCGGTVGIAGLALVASLGACASVVFRKRR